ncbi:MAG TPA: hypothetical protein VFJ89_07865 [Nocardioides sp.]|jgi:hypothetical protein|nr:hypothetical protein [Nocardioides sp.]
MTHEHSFYLVLTLLACATALLGLVVRRAVLAFAAVTVLLLAAALGAAWLHGFHGATDLSHRGLVLVAGVLAVSGGGLVTTAVFSVVDGQERGRDGGEGLRGGAWIGALERLAVFAALVVGWGPGLAIVLAVKGLGRYPELRGGEDTRVAERFIIGTFTSVLWAAACAGLAVLAP